MKYRSLLLLLVPSAFLSLTAFAQDQLLTIENTVFAQRDSLVPRKPAQLGWIKGTNNYYYVDKKNAKETLVSVSADKGNSSAVVTLDELNSQMKKINKPGVAEMKTFPFVVWTSSTSFIFDAGNFTATYNTQSNRLTMAVKPPYPQNATNFDESPETGYVAYTVDNNLFVNKNETLDQVKIGRA